MTKNFILHLISSKFLLQLDYCCIETLDVETLKIAQPMTIF